MTHDEMRDAVSASVHPREVCPLRSKIDAETDTAVRERIALALRAMDHGEIVDAREWLERAANHLRFA